MVREGRVKRDRLRGNCLGLVARAGIGVVWEEPREGGGGVFIQSPEKCQDYFAKPRGFGRHCHYKLSSDQYKPSSDHP